MKINFQRLFRRTLYEFLKSPHLDLSSVRSAQNSICRIVRREKFLNWVKIVACVFSMSFVSWSIFKNSGSMDNAHEILSAAFSVLTTLVSIGEVVSRKLEILKAVKKQINTINAGQNNQEMEKMCKEYLQKLIENEMIK